METSNLYKLISKFNFNGVSFVSLKNYSSDKSENTEVADILINVGVSYVNMKQSDIETLKNAREIDLITDSFDMELIKEAIKSKLESLTNPNENRSKGQTENLVHLNNGIVYAPNTDNLLISGVVVRKTVLKSGIYKEVKSKPLTLAKKHIEKMLDLKTSKIRYYKLSNLGTCRVSGDTFEIH